MPVLVRGGQQFSRPPRNRWIPSLAPTGIVGANLTNGSDTSTATVYTTASITPTANALILLAVTGAHVASVQPLQPTITGNGLTWTLVTGQDHDNIGTTRVGMWLYRAVGASPSAGAVTITFPASIDGAIWSVEQFTGTPANVSNNGSAAIVQTDVLGNATTGTSITATLAAFASSDNRPYAVVAHSSDEVTTPEVGYTEFSDNSLASPLFALQTEWKSTATDTSPSASWATSVGCGMIAVELAKGVAGNLFMQAADATSAFAPIVVRRTGKLIAAAITLTVAIARSILKPIAVAATFTAAVARRTARTIAAATTLTPAVVRRTLKTIAAGMTATAAVAASHVFTKLVAVTATFTAAVSRMALKAIPLGATFTAVVVRSARKTTALSATFTPVVSRTTARTIAVGATLTAAVVKSARKVINVASTFTAAVASLFTPFSPSQVADLKFWVEGDMLALANGAAVTTWEDGSSANNDVTQATAGNKPSKIDNAINGLPVVRFDGSADFLQSASNPDYPDQSPFTVFAVAKSDTIASGWGRLLSHESSAVRGWAYGRQDSEHHLTTLFAKDYVGPTTWDTTDFHFVAATLDAGFDVDFYEDGVLGSTVTHTANAVASPTDPFNVGRLSAGAGQYWDGDIALLIVVARDLTGTSDWDAITGYIIDKYFGGPTFEKLISAALTGTVAVAKQTGKLISAATTLTTAISKMARKAIAVTATFTAAVSRSARKTVALGATLAPQAIRKTLKAIPLAGTFTAQVIRKTLRTIALGVTFTVTAAGEIIAGAQQYFKTVAVDLVSSVAVSKLIAVTRAVTSSFVASVQRMAGKLISVSVTFSTALIKTVGKAVNVAATFSVAIQRDISRAVSVTAPMVAQVNRLTTKTFDVVVPFVAAITRGFFKTVSLVVTFTVTRTQQFVDLFTFHVFQAVRNLAVSRRPRTDYTSAGGRVDYSTTGAERKWTVGSARRIP